MVPLFQWSYLQNRLQETGRSGAGIDNSTGAQSKGMRVLKINSTQELNAFKQEAAEKDFQLEVAIADHKLQIEEKNKFIQESMDTLESMVDSNVTVTKQGKEATGNVG